MEQYILYACTVYAEAMVLDVAPETETDILLLFCNFLYKLSKNIKCFKICSKC